MINGALPLAAAVNSDGVTGVLLVSVSLALEEEQSLVLSMFTEPGTPPPALDHSPSVQKRHSPSRPNSTLSIMLDCEQIIHCSK